MAKNKKKKAQMFRNFLAFKAGQVNQVNQPSSFQTPHGDQEKLTELIDDVGGTSQAKDTTSTSSKTTVPAQKISKWTALKPVEDSGNLLVNMRQTNDNKHPNVTVVEGSASKIQLVIDKTKKISQPINSPKPVEEVKTNIPIQTPSPQPKETQPKEAQPKEPQTPQTQNLQSIPQSAYTPIKSNATRLSSQQAPVPRYAAGIPKPTLVSINRIDKNPSPLINIQTESASHTQPYAPYINRDTYYPSGWPASRITNQPRPCELGSGWPKSMAPPFAPMNDSHWPTQQVNDLNVKIDGSMPPQAYSPSDAYSEGVNNEEMHARKSSLQASIGVTDEEAESPEIIPTGSKRLSAFQRLGPLAEQPKKTKLTINLLCQKDVRNVVDETDDIPTHQRDYITKSTDEIVVKYLDAWPFKKNIAPVRTATVRLSKSVMILETEYMEEAYSRDNRFIIVSVTGYPPHWRKEDVLDAVLESVKGKTFIPCFIEFSRVRCRFFVIRCRLALLAIHKYGFIIRQGEVELIVAISNIHINLNQLDFVPRLVLRKILAGRLDDTSLDLSEFTTKSDISHFLYFPLHRIKNQSELIELQSTIPWECLTTLNLSHNRIENLSGIDFLQTMPKLQHLDLSHNCIEKATMLLKSRNLPLKTLRLEGNPLCLDYIEQDHYIKVLTMMFTGLVEIDGVKIKHKNALPDAHRNYSPAKGSEVAEKMLEVLFPLLDAPEDQRHLIQNLYWEDAVLTITYMYKLRYNNVFKDYRNLFNRARVLDEGYMASVDGVAAIAKVIDRWPAMIHDPTTFTVDVMFHNKSTTIVRVGGIVKITTESLAEEEHLLSFTRTLVLHTKDGNEYKIINELLYWDLPLKEYAETAFQVTKVQPKNFSLKLDAPLNDDLKEKLLNVFMELTELERQPSERCLEEKEWNFKNALDYFTKLLKLGNLDPIMQKNTS